MASVQGRRKDRQETLLKQVAAKKGILPRESQAPSRQTRRLSAGMSPHLAQLVRRNLDARDIVPTCPSRPAGALCHPALMREPIWDAADPAPLPGWDCSGPWNPEDVSPRSGERATYMPLLQETAGEYSASHGWHEKSWRDVAGNVLASMAFQSVIACLIVLNALVIGLETDQGELPVWDAIEDMFLFAFATELCLKLVVHRPCVYFDVRTSDFSWNLLDFIIVSLGIVDFVLGLLSGPDVSSLTGGGVATIFRMIRLLRILRIFRIVKFLKQLYMLAFGFALAAVAVSWVTFLMVFVLYVCSILLVRTVGRAPEDDPHRDFLHNKFGTIVRAMLTLFEIMAAPTLEEYEDVIWSRPWLALFIIVFIIFGSFGMIALLTGVISESMFDKNNIRLEEERIERENTRKLLVLTCGKLFDELPSQTQDNAQEGAHSWEVLGLLPKITALFESEGVDYASEDLYCMLDIIDASGSGIVTRDEFKFFIVQMAEGVRPLLVLRIYYAVEVMRRQSEDCQASLEERIIQRLGLTPPVQQVVENAGTEGQVLQEISALSKKFDTVSGSVRGLQTSVSRVSTRVEQVAGEVAAIREDALLAAARAESVQADSRPGTPSQGSGLFTKVARGMFSSN